MHHRRAYKLGKKRWSYNQCELKLLQQGGDQRLEVAEAVQVLHPAAGRICWSTCSALEFVLTPPL